MIVHVIEEHRNIAAWFPRQELQHIVLTVRQRCIDLNEYAHRRLGRIDGVEPQRLDGFSEDFLLIVLNADTADDFTNVVFFQLAAHLRQRAREDQQINIAFSVTERGIRHEVAFFGGLHANARENTA